jgi:flagellin-specific chaperone FliS
MPFIVLLPEIIEILNNIPDLSAKVNEISQKLMSLLKLFVFGLINDNEKSIIEEIEKIYEIIDQVQMMFNESALMGNREYDKLLEKLYESFENVLRRKNLILL